MTYPVIELLQMLRIFQPNTIEVLWGLVDFLVRHAGGSHRNGQLQVPSFCLSNSAAGGSVAVTPEIIRQETCDARS